MGHNPGDIEAEPYRLDTELTSRSISFENPTGEPGEGGKEASNLGPGRKGRPMVFLDPGEEVQLCDIVGSGTIRHVWMTVWWVPRRQASIGPRWITTRRAPTLTPR